jgi:hypothetical protein
MNEGFERVKKHIKEHKDTYIIGITTLIASIAVVVVKQKTIKIKMVNNGQINKINNITYQKTISPYGNDLGRRGNVILDLTTGKVYRSQKLAALKIGVSDSRMSKHMANKIPHLNGHEFVFMKDVEEYYDY